MTAPISTSPDWFHVVLGLFGGLALFLFGLEQLSEGLKKAAGDALKTLLTRLTSNRFLGVLTGAAVTGILNSSSVTTVLVVGFVTAGVMTLAQSVAVIMGANIGSTLTAQILAFNISAYALLPVAVGFLLFLVGKRGKIGYWGMIIMGLGLVFYGMGVMSDAMKPLRTYQPFVETLTRMETPALGILGGALFTALVQSSAATVGLAMALAADGLLSLPAGIALTLGANIGTCVTAQLAALGKPAPAVRASLVHILFNVIGVLIWLPLIGVLAKMAIAVSPTSSEADAAARLAAETPRQIANANTLFNVFNTALFIGFTGWFARLTEILIPVRKRDEASVAPQFIDPAAQSVPTVAFEQVRQELGRVGGIVQAMLAELPKAREAKSGGSWDEIRKRDQQVQTLEGAIVDFLGLIRKSALTQVESQTDTALMAATVHFRAIADIVADDLATAVQAANRSPSINIDPPLVSELYQKVQQGVELAVRAVQHEDAEAAETVQTMSGDVRRLAEELMSRLASGFEAGDKDAPATLRLQTTFVDAIRQVFTLAKRIARSVLAGEGRDHE